MKQLAAVAVAALALVSTPALAADAPAHLLLHTSDLQWVPAPPSLPPGSQIAVVQGDPGGTGPFVMRFRAPAGYRIPPHWHPTTENVTVLSGVFHVGMGEAFDSAAMTAVAPGGYVSLPAEMRHFAWAETDAEIQIHGTGPFVLNYVDPADDPRAAVAQAAAPTG